MTSSMIERHLGGESGKRGMLGSGGSKSRNKGMVASFGLFAFLAMFADPIIGLIVGVVGVVGTWLFTLQTGPGANAWARRQTSRRVKDYARTGLDVFRPVADRPAALDDRVTTGTKPERKLALREWATYRDQHPGADGMAWLRAIPGEPGIAWHAPVGEDAYLAVVFPIGGQIVGLESDGRVSSVAQRFGQMLAAHGELNSRVRRTQLLTRLLPVDTAAHEAWVLENVDRGRDEQGAPLVAPDLLQSYAQVVDQLHNANGGLGQRHFCVMRWPMTPRLLAAGGRRGEGVTGLVRMMDSEIEAAHRRLAEAGLAPGLALTAARVAALMRHQQCPGWPIDFARDLNPRNPVAWLAEDGSARDHSVVSARVPQPAGDQEAGFVLGDEQQWLHATARVPIEEVETGPRTPLWMLPVLSRLGQGVVRTVSIEFETVPAAQARRQAREDLTVDLADIESQKKKGVLIGPELEEARKAASARTDDLAPGTGHHGGYWCMHLTVSGPTRDALIQAMDLLDEAAGNCGISSLEWLEGFGTAHHGVTWPLARALRTPKVGAAERARALMAGKGHKDALR